MRAREIILLVALTVAAVGSWYASRTNRPQETPAAVVDAPHRGYYLKSARILGTAPDGNLLYEIEADSAEQIDNDTVQFTDVNIRYSPGSEVPWIVDADTARLHYDRQRVQLSGHVLARSEGGFGGQDTELRTDYLELDPESFLAETDSRVQIRIGERSLTATGMSAALKEDRVQLKSNVRGKFVP